MQKIITAAALSKDDCVLEVGPGLGALTQALAGHAGHVVAVELDKQLVTVLQETLAAYPVTIIQGDILKLDVPAIMADYPHTQHKVVANLPYYITTPVVMHLLTMAFTSITVMVQREVAERMKAKPGTKDYGSLSLAVQYRADVDIVAYVPPNSFMPRPAVDSAVVHLTLCKPRVDVDADILFRVIHAAFNQRRKTLQNALFAAELGPTKAEWAEIIAANGLPANIRGEVLDLHQFAAIAKMMMAQ